MIARADITAKKLFRGGKRKGGGGYARSDRAEIISALFVAQACRCAACGRPGTLPIKGSNGGTRGVLVLDHCHATGKPRALLCVQCNAALGMLAESRGRFAGLFKYLVEVVEPIKRGAAA